MVELYIGMLGDLGQAIVSFYRQNQLVLNAIVLIYGLVLALAHRNLRVVEAMLRKASGVEDMKALAGSLTPESISPELLEQMRSAVRPPIIASPWHFGVRKLSADSVRQVVIRKYLRRKEQ